MPTKTLFPSLIYQNVLSIMNPARILSIINSTLIQPLPFRQNVLKCSQHLFFLETSASNQRQHASDNQRQISWNQLCVPSHQKSSALNVPSFLTHFMPLILFDTHRKHQSASGFLNLQGVSKEISGIKWVKKQVYKIVKGLNYAHGIPNSCWSSLDVLVINVVKLA